ncbi:MAG TPA: MAPEG family protein [Micropepsaceae bacterium]|nr:MAPEG family protein [Micropepsaceae bacterium]
MTLLTPLQVLVALALWALVLVGVVALVRVGKVLSGQRKPNGFPANEPGSELVHRAPRAYANITENLPIIAAIILSGILVGVRSENFVLLANVLLAARVVQSVIHLISVSNFFVNLRFLAYLVQVICLAIMGITVFQAIGQAAGG